MNETYTVFMRLDSKIPFCLPLIIWRGRLCFLNNNLSHLNKLCCCQNDVGHNNIVRRPRHKTSTYLFWKGLWMYHGHTQNTMTNVVKRKTSELSILLQWNRAIHLNKCNFSLRFPSVSSHSTKIQLIQQISYHFKLIKIAMISLFAVVHICSTICAQCQLYGLILSFCLIWFLFDFGK